MDLLVVGMNGKGNVALGGMTETEYRTHFAAWCFFGVPLMMGADLRSVDDTSRLLMQNRELIAINQDAECRPPFFVFKEENNQRIAAIRHLSDGSFALGCFNLSDMDRYFSIFLKDIGIPLHSGCKVELTNIFTGETTYHTENAHQPVFAHDCAILRGRLIK
jgi:alpha-galactosidase